MHPFGTPPTTVRMILAGALAALLTFTLLLVGQHLWEDHQTYHLLLGLTNYNLQQGKLQPMQPQGPSQPPAPTPSPAPSR